MPRLAPTTTPPIAHGNARAPAPPRPSSSPAPCPAGSDSSPRSTSRSKTAVRMPGRCGVELVLEVGELHRPWRRASNSPVEHQLLVPFERPGAGRAAPAGEDDTPDVLIRPKSCRLLPLLDLQVPVHRQVHDGRRDVAHVHPFVEQGAGLGGGEPVRRLVPARRPAAPRDPGPPASRAGTCRANTGTGMPERPVAGQESRAPGRRSSVPATAPLSHPTTAVTPSWKPSGSGIDDADGVPLDGDLGVLRRGAVDAVEGDGADAR